MPAPAPVPDRAPSPRIALGALALGVAFVGANLAFTQDRPAFAASPWHDDPFHAVVLAAIFTTTILVAAIAVRMLAWTAPGGRDREQQLNRAAGVLTAVTAIAAAFQWTSVAAHDHGRAWNGSTAVQIAALAVVSAAAAAVGAGLAAVRTRGDPGTRWEQDWLGDAARLAGRVPVLGRAVTPVAVAWIRSRAIGLFAGLSVLAAAPVVAAQAVGEGWTDPVLIGWALGVLTATLFAFGVIANALAGFVARPPRSARRRVAERSLVAGCLAIALSEAFHDQIWRALTGHAAGTAGTLVVITGGAGVLAAAACAVLPRTRRRDRPGFVSAGSGGAR